MTAMTLRAARLCTLALLPLLAASPAGAQDIASMLPPETLAHVEINGEPLHRIGGRLAIARIMNEPEVRDFLRSAEALAGAGYEQMTATLERFGVEFEDLLELTRGPITLSFLGMTAQSMPDIVVTCNLKHAKDASLRLRVALARALLQASGAEPKQIDIGGHPGTMLAPNGGPPVIHTVIDGMMLLGTNPTSLGQMVRRMEGADDPSLAGTPRWTRVAAELRTKDDIGYAWANVGGLLQAFGDEMPQEAGMALRLYGYESIEAMGFAFSLDGAGFRDRVFMLAPELDGLLGHLSPKREHTLVADRMVPADAVVFSQAALDFGAILRWGLQVADQVEPGAGEEARAQINALSDQVGFDLEKDLLHLLGPEIAFYAALPGQALVPDVGILVQVSDTTKAEVNLTRLVQGLGSIPVKTLEYQGTKISYADLGGLGLDWDEVPPLKPTWTVINDHLLITLWPQSAKNLIRGLKAQEPRLADKPEYKRLLAQLRERNPDAGNGGRNYTDLKRLVGFILDNGVPFAQSLIPPIPGMPDIEWAAFPSTEAVTQHMFGMMGTTTWTKDGAIADYISPMGIGPVYVGLLGAVGVASLKVSTAAAIHERDMAIHERDMAIDDVIKSEIKMLAQAVRVHQLAEGRLPNESEWPKFLFAGSKKHPAPYIQHRASANGHIHDPWGNPYVYKKSGAKDFEIISYGADGAPGGVAPHDRDISSKRDK